MPQLHYLFLSVAQSTSFNSMLSSDAWIQSVGREIPSSSVCLLMITSFVADKYRLQQSVLCPPVSDFLSCLKYLSFTVFYYCLYGGSILGQSVSFPCSVPWKPVSIFLLCFWISLFLAAIHYTCCSSSQLLLSSHIATVYVSFSLGLTSMSFCETHARLGVT